MKPELQEFHQKLLRLQRDTTNAIRLIESDLTMTDMNKQGVRIPENPSKQPAFGPYGPYGKGGFAIGDFVVRDRFPDGIPGGVEVSS